VISWFLLKVLRSQKGQPLRFGDVKQDDFWREAVGKDFVDLGGAAQAESLNPKP
jgi:hypothetical protein